MASTTALAWLIGGVIIGVAAYVGAMLLLWVVAGRPDGAERIVIAKVRQRLRSSSVAEQPAQT
jgi:hypothetical protein